jgi:DNA modification methylase
MQKIESETPISRIGDVWLLGAHRLVCGDSCNARIVGLALNGAVPRLMVTDPPYGVSYDPAWREDPRLKPLIGTRRGKTATGKVLNDDRCDWTAAWRLFPGDVVYVWHSSLHGDEVKASLVGAGFRPRNQIIWDKQRLIISRGHYHWRHEPCWYAVRKGATANWQGGRKQTTVWQVLHKRSPTGHAAQKPLFCMERPILNHTLPGDAVYDPFVGSGTTIIAAEQTGRIAIAIELNPAYCDMAVKRWQELTAVSPRRL